MVSMRIYIDTNDGYDDPAMHCGVQSPSPPHSPLSSVSTLNENMSSCHTDYSSDLVNENNVAEGDSQSIVCAIMAPALEGLSPRDVEHLMGRLGDPISWVANTSATPLFILDVAEGYPDSRTHRVADRANELGRDFEDWLPRVSELPPSSPHTVDQILTYDFYFPSDDMDEDVLHNDGFPDYTMDSFPVSIDEDDEIEEDLHMH